MEEEREIFKSKLVNGIPTYNDYIQTEDLLNSGIFKKLFNFKLKEEIEENEEEYERLKNRYNIDDQPHSHKIEKDSKKWGDSFKPGQGNFNIINETNENLENCKFK